MLLLAAPAAAQSPEMPDPFFRPIPTPTPAHELDDPWQGATSPPVPDAGAPVSTSGTDVVPPQMRVPLVRNRSDPATVRRLRWLEGRIRALERQQRRELSWWNRVRLSAFVQPQFVAQRFNADASPNAGAGGVLPNGVDPNQSIPLANGDTTNAVFFRMRRARLRVDFAPIEAARLVMEIDPLPRTKGVPESGTFLRQVEGQLWARLGRTAFGGLSMGMMRVPFGHELLEQETARPFAERSFGAQSLFPGEYDLGARADVHAGGDRLVATAAVVNGRTVGEQQGSVLPDLNRGKDAVVRVHYRGSALGGGASAYVGAGQRVDPAGLRLKQFSRWAFGADAQVHHTFDDRLGMSRAMVEVVLGENMDRGVLYPFALPDIPDDVTAPVEARHEASIVVRLEQDTTRWLTWGLRVDAYTPDLRLEDDLRVTAGFSGAVRFTKNLTLVLEYSHARDTIRPVGAPQSYRHVSTGSALLQAAF